MPVLTLGGCRVTQGTETVVFNIQPWSDDGVVGRRLTSDHFTIISTIHDEEFELSLPQFLESAYQRYAATIPPRATAEGDASITKDRLTMYVLGSRGEWSRFTRIRFPSRFEAYSRIRFGGYTEPDLSAIFYAGRAITLATLIHEGWHQYVNLHVGTPIPAWLNEGLACYHEAFEIADGRLRFTPKYNTFRINDLRNAVRRNRVMSLRELIETDAGQVLHHDRRDMTPAYYAQAWALMTFLRHGAGLRYAARFDDMLRDIADGSFAAYVSAAKVTCEALDGDTEPASSSLAAFTAYFGAPDETLQEAYYNHLVITAGFE